MNSKREYKFLLSIDFLIYKILFNLNDKNISRCILFSNHRSGSTLLTSTLRNHPDIELAGNGGEILNIKNTFQNKKLSKFEKIILRNFLPLSFTEKKCFRPKTNVIGFKVFPTHFPHIHKYFLNNGNYKKIILERKNRLAMYTSKEVARKTKEWIKEQSIESQTESSQKTIVTVEINLNRLEAYINRIDKYYDQFSSIDKKNEVFYVTYEDLVDSTREVVQKITTFLGVEEKNLVSNLEKQGSKNVLSHITNKAEVVEYCNNIGHPEWLS